eukprot:147470-Prymnesium_polylepis.1
MPMIATEISAAEITFPLVIINTIVLPCRPANNAFERTSKAPWVEGDTWQSSVRRVCVTVRCPRDTCGCAARVTHAPHRAAE